MKTFLLLMLALHVLMEGVVGLLLMVSPETMAPGLDASVLTYAIFYGAAGVSIALVVAWFWPHRSNLLALTLLLGVLATFHTLVAVAGALVAIRGGGLHIVGAHGAFAICFWLLWLRRNALV